MELLCRCSKLNCTITVAHQAAPHPHLSPCPACGSQATDSQPAALCQLALEVRLSRSAELRMDQWRGPSAAAPCSLLARAALAACRSIASWICADNN